MVYHVNPHGNVEASRNVPIVVQHRVRLSEEIWEDRMNALEIELDQAIKTSFEAEEWHGPGSDEHQASIWAVEVLEARCIQWTQLRDAVEFTDTLRACAPSA